MKTNTTANQLILTARFYFRLQEIYRRAHLEKEPDWVENALWAYAELAAERLARWQFRSGAVSAGLVKRA